MTALLYYLLIYPFTALFSRVPLPFLYRLSSFAAFLLFRIIGYRKQVVYENLSKAFPEKKPQEILHLMKEFYHSFCDVVVETLAFRRMKPEDLKARVKADEETIQLMQELQNKNILLIAGHLGNWEWTGQSVIVNHSLSASSAYHPLSNKYVDRLIKSIRSHMGMQLVPMKEVTRFMASRHNKTFALALVADQAAPPESAFWTDFMHRPAAFFRGPGKLAIRYALPVVYLGNTRVSRGHYTVHATLLWKGNSSITEDELLEKFVRTLEQDIYAQPGAWLWSHRKWKHKKPEK